MVWQDKVLFVTSFLFTFALIPQVYKGFKEKKTINCNANFSHYYTLIVYCFFYILYFKVIFRNCNDSYYRHIMAHNTYSKAHIQVKFIYTTQLILEIGGIENETNNIKHISDFCDSNSCRVRRTGCRKY